MKAFGLTPENIKKDVGIPSRFDYKYTKEDKTLNYYDPLDGGNSIRISENQEQSGFHWDIVIDGNYYDEAGNRMAGKS